MTILYQTVSLNISEKRLKRNNMKLSFTGNDRNIMMKIKRRWKKHMKQACPFSLIVAMMPV